MNLETDDGLVAHHTVGPAAQTAASPALRRALLAAFGIAVALLFFALRRRGDSVGLFAPLTPPDRIDEASVDQLTEAILRLLGLPAREARRLATRPLPTAGDW